MAAITFDNTQLTVMRKWCSDGMVTAVQTAGITKPLLNASFQALENLIESVSTQTAISSAIDTATAPTTFSAAQKRLIVRAYFLLKYQLS